MDSKHQTGSGRIQALEKGIRIVNALKTLKTAGPSEIAEILDVPISTVHVYLKTLQELGYVTNEKGKYRLSLRFLEIGGHARNQYRVHQIAKYEMRQLAFVTGHTVGLGVKENGKRVLLQQVEGLTALNDNIFIGEYTHLHWTSLGKALLVNESRKGIEHVVDRHGLPKATENTITDRDDLIEEIDQIGEKGYAIEDEERKIGIRSVSVPIFDDNENVIGAIGINAPKNEFDSAVCAEYAGFLEYASNRIAIQYNYYS